MSKKSVLYIVATPIGNLGDISVRAQQVLNEVDEVWAEDTRHSRRLMTHLGLAPKLVACHEYNERASVERLIEKLTAGSAIALISDAGTPLVSDPGYRLVRACHQHGFAVRPIPGACAMIAALSVSGVPTDRFCFEGFLPGKARARDERLRQLCGEPRTLIFYESSHRICASLESMCRALGASRQVAMARELTKLHETVMQASLQDLVEVLKRDAWQKRGEFVLCVAGARTSDNRSPYELRRVLSLLLPQMSLKSAANTAAAIVGVSRKQSYTLALVMRDGQV